MDRIRICGDAGKPCPKAERLPDLLPATFKLHSWTHAVNEMAGNQAIPRVYQQRQRAYRRARIACLTCRRRKVRCSVTSEGKPCTNCRLDNIECITFLDKHGRNGVDRTSTRAVNHHADLAEHTSVDMDWNTLPTPKETGTGDQTAGVVAPVEVTAEEYPVIGSEAQLLRHVPEEPCEWC